jgi:ATP/maltotriose-dependent transcriptional regulator MalT
LNETRLRELGITRRELEILELIANGLSNREIAEKLFVSENTVKTHSSRLFDKLSARRRTPGGADGKRVGIDFLEWHGRPARDSRARCACHMITHPKE